MKSLTKTLLCVIGLGVALAGCETYKEMSTEDVCEQLISCGETAYANANVCVQKLESELKAYPDCDLELEDYVDCRVEYLCEGEYDFDRECKVYREFLTHCHEAYDLVDEMLSDWDYDWWHEDEEEDED